MIERRERRFPIASKNGAFGVGSLPRGRGNQRGSIGYRLLIIGLGIFLLSTSASVTLSPLWVGASFVIIPQAAAQENEDGISNTAASDDQSEDDQNEIAFDAGDRSINDIASISEKDSASLNILSNDRLQAAYINSSLTIESLSAPMYGSITYNYDGTVTYTPFQLPLMPNSTLIDVFYYTVSVNQGASFYAGQVTIYVKQVDDPPIAVDKHYWIDKNTEVTIPLSGYDEDGEAVSASVVGKPTIGSFSLDSESGLLTYSPYTDFTGDDQIQYTVSDSIYTSAPGTIMITILESGGNATTVLEEESESDSGTDVSNSTSGQGEDDGADSGNDNSTNDTTPGDNSTNAGDGSSNNNDTSSNDSGNSTNSSDSGGSGNDSGNSSGSSDSGDSGNTGGQSGGSSSPPTVQIDIMPGVYPNQVNTNKAGDQIPVAILGSSSLDLPSDIDMSSLEFGPNSASPTSTKVRDVDGDGFNDLVAYYTIGDLGLTKSDKEACQTGEIQFNGDAIAFEACDSIYIVNQNR